MPGVGNSNLSEISLSPFTLYSNGRWSRYLILNVSIEVGRDYNNMRKQLVHILFMAF